MVKTKRKECHSFLKILSNTFNYVSKHSILLRVVDKKNKWIFVFKKKIKLNTSVKKQKTSTCFSKQKHTLQCWRPKETAGHPSQCVRASFGLIPALIGVQMQKQKSASMINIQFRVDIPVWLS